MSHTAMFFVTVALAFQPLLATQSHGQITQTISGVVRNADTDAPIMDANVFIAGSTLGSASDEKGRFEIDGVPPGTFDVVASFIGYDVHTRRIRVTDAPVSDVVFRLEPKFIQGPTLEITASEKKEWQHNLEEFKRLFLGETENASHCKIENPFILDFRNDDKGFRAFATEPVVIINNALGYKLSVVLQMFHNVGDMLRYAGIPRFERLPVEKDWQERVWRRNRLKAYRGSLRHFIATVCKFHDLAQQQDDAIPDQNYLHERGYDGFKAFQVENPWGKRKIYNAEIADVTQFVRGGNLANERKLSFSNFFDVTYIEEMEESHYRMVRNEYRGIEPQRSLITLNVDTLIVTTTGRIETPFGVRTYGYWAWEKIAEMLPFDYTPPQQDVSAQ